MWSGVRCTRAALFLLVAPLHFAACGRSVRHGEADDDANAGENTGGRGGTGSSTGGKAAGGSSAGGSSAGGSSGGGRGGSAGTGGESARGGSGGDGGQELECVLARTVECCPKWAPVTRADIEANECLVAYGSDPAPGALERCGATLCPEQECALHALPSRVLEPDGNGGCQYASECETVGDCVVAVDCCACCACETPTPGRALLGGSCFLASDPARPGEPPGGCDGCPAVECAPCTPRNDTQVSCNPTPEGPKRCEWGPQLTAQQCATDRPCANRFAGQNMRCYAPDEPYCGGPPPLPDECAVDVDCQTDATREHFVCEPSGHCSMRQCVPGCLSNDDCSVAETCGADHRCTPKPCSLAATCGNDHVCGGMGVCQRKNCGTSVACGGYCVNGFCHETPGSCADANAP